MVDHFASAAALAANILRLDHTEKATLIPPAMFSNQGFTYGSFVWYIAMGALGLKSNLANACWLTTNLVAIPLADVTGRTVVRRKISSRQRSCPKLSCSVLWLRT